MKAPLRLLLLALSLSAAACSTSGAQLMKPGRPMPGMSGMSNMKMDGMSMDDASMGPLAVEDAVTKVIHSQGINRSFFRVKARVATSGDGWASFAARPSGAGADYFAPAAGLARMKGSSWVVVAVEPISARCHLARREGPSPKDVAYLFPGCATSDGQR